MNEKIMLIYQVFAATRLAKSLNTRRNILYRGGMGKNALKRRFWRAVY